MKSERHQKANAARRREEKPCEWCEEPMQALSHSRFCSNRCRQAAKYARTKGTHKYCGNCGKTFKPRLSSQRTCSAKCRRQLQAKEKKRANNR